MSKVCVYAIAKNEEKNAKKWYDSMKEADEIYVLIDGNSTDKTEELLTSFGVHCKKKLIHPWRFDKARNESLKLVPKDADICVCTDLDEVFEPGWRKALEENWKPDTNQASYYYWHNAYDNEGNKDLIFYSKIHDRKHFKWKWIIHEYIVPKSKKFYPNVVDLRGKILLKHYPDLKKNRPYNKLLELAVKKNKKDNRYLLLLIEDCIYRKETEKADYYLNRIFAGKTNKPSHPEELHAYKMKIQNEVLKNNLSEAKKYCYIALSKETNCRVFYAELAKITFELDKDYELSTGLYKKSLTFSEDVILGKESEWKNIPYIWNLISINYYYQNKFAEAIECVNISLGYEPKNETYLKNKELYEKCLEDKEFNDLKNLF